MLDIMHGIHGAPGDIHAHADKQVFPSLDIVGWYATGETVQEADMVIHRKV